MNSQTIKSGQWMIIEEDHNSHTLFKLRKGKVGIFCDGEKIKTVEVKDGDKPIMIGFLATLREDSRPIASVKAETELEVDVLNASHLKGILKYDTPKNLKEDINIMIESIMIRNRLTILEKKLLKKPIVKLEIPQDINPEVSEVLTELSGLYEQVSGSG